MGNCLSSAAGQQLVGRIEEAFASSAPPNRTEKEKTSNTANLGRNKTTTSQKFSNNNYVQKPAQTTTAADEYSNADASKWQMSELKFGGSFMYEKIGQQQQIKGKSIATGIHHFKANPGKYLAMLYQSNMVGWPAEQVTYTYIHRAGTQGYKPQGVGKSGSHTLLMQEYQLLPALRDNLLPPQYRDRYTDSVLSHYGRRQLHSNSNKPILPGRGMGVGDSPKLKIVGDIDPSDIHQGSVGNCWMLSGISALAEFDGAVLRLFRKTKDLDEMPTGKPNMYTITLWDLSTWREVDIQVDERLCVTADGSGQLLGAKPSEDGELWVCYLEKALAAHCGGWDKITGGQCTHAWALMTGCKEQYTIRKNPKTGRYGCFAKYNPYEKRWAVHANAPREGEQSLWSVAWPAVGGGGGTDKELNEDELFMKMCAWDKENYIVGAGTTGTSDKNRTDGMVDNHAYTVIESIHNVAGSRIDLIKVRNPWGKGEIEDGMFDDDGPGWDKYPAVKRALNPVVADDGIFWVTKQEFFKHFQTIYLSASNMTDFLGD